MNKIINVVLSRRAAVSTLLHVCLVFSFAGPSFSVESKATTLIRVDPVKVCMVNNTLFEKNQIPVEVSGKTYYGCCEMCKARLNNDPQARQAIDPVSKKQVDKANAVIGASADGRVFYFESEENLTKFSN